ncbi:MAG TPA: S8 family serine peptidase [Sedimentisphaerales bacterium]|nr:S8 family serine peptidase [Sedimentisphaerales bacterium]HRS11693.1 S8 family serine peptidase [Sedimentisphaerales bacterium]HRV48356.1 S8 family serine peptidase [Sedimentisphaerales bacterium]
MNATRNILSLAWVVAATAAFYIFCTPVSAKAYRLTVAGEGMEFVPQPERGYVVKVPERAGGFYSLAGLPALDTENVRPVGGRDRRGVWTVENEGPAGRNEEMIRALRAGGHATYATPLFSCGGETVAVIPEIVIRVRPEVDLRQVHFLCQSLALAVIKPMEFTTQEYLLEVLGPDAEAVFAAVEQLNEVDVIEWACPNTAMRPKLVGQTASNQIAWAGQSRSMTAGEETERTGVFPNDEYFPMQWHLYNTGQSGGTPGADIRAPEAWEITTGDPNIVVAVLGTGVDCHHPDLVENLVPGYDFYDDDDDPDPADRDRLDAHDTLCAGLVAARGNNGIGITGVAWDCKIMPIRLGDAQSWATAEECATAIRWAAVHGADVLSNSWSWGTTSPTPILHSAIVETTQAGSIGRGGKGCVMVFAAGNSSGPKMVYPNKYPEVIAVGATDREDVLWPYSTYGVELALTAPSGCDGSWCGEMASFWSTDQTGSGGYSILNSDPNLLDYSEYGGGTSLSCPIVAGVAALVLSIEPELSNEEVRHFMTRSAKDLGGPGWDEYYGWGRVDACAALDMVLAKRCDLNNDWKVDEEDEAILLEAVDANDLSADIAPAAKRDGVVDEQDLDLLMHYSGTEIPEFSLIAHWKLDETEGVVAHDSVGKNDATVIGVPVWQPEGGMVGGALQLDGVDDYLETPHIVNPADGPFSVFAWIREGAPGQVVVSQAGGAYSKRPGANWLLADPSTGALRTDLEGEGRDSRALCSQTMISDGSWHRVGLVWDGDSRTLYVDEIVAAQDTQVGGPAGCYADLNIGCDKDMTAGTFWSGLIDDVRIYDRAVRP